MQINILPLFIKENLKNRPEDFVVTEETCRQIEQAQATRRAQQEKNAPPPDKKDLNKEYNRLRQQLFELTQNAKCFEQRRDDAAGKIRLLEQRIDEQIKLKKDAIANSNLRGERSYEHGIQLLENELADAKEEFENNKRWSVQSARTLKAFDGHGRIAELKPLLDAPEKK